MPQTNTCKLFLLTDFSPGTYFLRSGQKFKDLQQAKEYILDDINKFKFFVIKIFIL